MVYKQAKKLHPADIKAYKHVKIHAAAVACSQLLPRDRDVF